MAAVGISAFDPNQTWWTASLNHLVNSSRIRALLETSIGAVAHLQIFAGLRELGWGREHFGPQILTDDFVAEPLRFEEFQVHLPAGPGIGVTLDHDKLRRYAQS